MSRSLLDKLGWTPGTPWRVTGAPEALVAAVTPHGAPGDAPSWLLVLVADRAALAERAPAALASYPRGGRLWFAYPKKTGAIPTDITRDSGWDPLVAAGFLPVTQIALDATWSALRFRRRDEIPKITRRS